MSANLNISRPKMLSSPTPEPNQKAADTFLPGLKNF